MKNIREKLVLAFLAIIILALVWKSAEKSLMDSEDIVLQAIAPVEHAREHFDINRVRANRASLITSLSQEEKNFLNLNQRLLPEIKKIRIENRWYVPQRKNDSSNYYGMQIPFEKVFLLPECPPNEIIKEDTNPFYKVFFIQTRKDFDLKGRVFSGKAVGRVEEDIGVKIIESRGKLHVARSDLVLFVDSLDTDISTSEIENSSWVEVDGIKFLVLSTKDSNLDITTELNEKLFE